VLFGSGMGDLAQRDSFSDSSGADEDEGAGRPAVESCDLKCFIGGV